MIDPHSLAAYSLQILDSSENAELEKRLGLYQVFLRLYDHHRSLLDEILELESFGNRTLSKVSLQYIQGVVHNDQVYLITNLLNQGQTQSLFQPQHVWLLGRDRHAAISIPDKRLSRRHAVVQYRPGEGFSVVDLSSTNGTFVNGEQIQQRRLLQDGDRVRLGSLSFAFFLCDRAQEVPEVPSDLLELLQDIPLKHCDEEDTASMASGKAPESSPSEPHVPPQEQTFLYYKSGQPSSHQASVPPFLGTKAPQLSSAQQEAILDRALRRQGLDGCLPR
ncbi:FHA domain-containing protein [Geitlerinema sp. PCC 7407]|uniref:FHA domain-containing protein n=1 Tax=Geitlerinema sp. PCC 7407 TaxID=1173025 RepID=UPI00029F9283|nr:FHA domain-containing protein [Geitlerinema sp. PCC 7407]AFY64586.1 FHA domain containing protein [Geitlerinema sp. PCC 7407]